MTTKEELIPYMAKVAKNLNAFDIQIGGDHYKHYAIQPLKFIEVNNLSFAQGCVIKYILRYKEKNGIEDLKKAKHYIDLIIESHTSN